MIRVPITLLHFEYSGDTVARIDNLLTDNELCWEARTDSVTLLFGFEETVIDEIRLDLAMSVAIYIEAANESDQSDKVLIAEKSEYLLTLQPKTAIYRNTEVCTIQHAGKLFSRLCVSLRSLDTKKNMRLRTVRLYRAEREAEKRKAEDSPAVLKKPKVDTAFKLQSEDRTNKSVYNNPPAPPVSPTVPVLRLPSMTYEKAETSYSQLLQECVITCFEDSEHVRRLCECLGAVFLDHLDDVTTHVIVGEGLRELCRDIEARTKAKLVSVGWLEGCLEDRARKVEEEYRLI